MTYFKLSYRKLVLYAQWSHKSAITGLCTTVVHVPLHFRFALTLFRNEEAKTVRT